jgi:murein hydrolase activator
VIIGLVLFAAANGTTTPSTVQRLAEVTRELDSNRANEDDLVQREHFLLTELDAVAASLAEAQERAQTLELRARSARDQLTAAHQVQIQARLAAEQASRQVRFALSRLLRSSSSGPARPILKALHRNLLRATKAHLTTLHRARASADQTQQRIAELVAHQSGLRDQIRQLVMARKTASKKVRDALAGVRADRRRAQAHAKALEARRLDMARWLESLRPALTGDTPGRGLRRGKLPLPVAGKLFNGYGWQEAKDGLSKWRNRGLDFQGSSGTRVVSVGEGRVAFVGRSGGLGLAVVIDHGNTWRTVYGGLGVDSVAVGDTVAIGDTLGRLGDLGQLHFELRRGTLAVNPTQWFTRPPSD